MQQTASFPADWFDALLVRLPSDLDLDALARETKAIERKRVLESGANLLRLSLARGPGGLSLSQTASWASLLGFSRVPDGVPHCPVTASLDQARLSPLFEAEKLLADIIALDRAGSMRPSEGVGTKGVPPIDRRPAARRTKGMVRRESACRLL